MDLFSLFKKTDINEGVRLFLDYPAMAVLLDVRTKEEYAQGHIKGSINIPLQEIEKAQQTVENKELPLFVYCRSGSRSAQAVKALKMMGYENARNIGGIIGYEGELIR